MATATIAATDAPHGDVVPARVLIILRTIPQYRRRFFELLRAHLAEEGVQLAVVYGQPEPDDVSKRDYVHLDWGVERRTVFIPVGSRYLLWQRCLDLAARADLVVVEQASRLLINYTLPALQAAGVTRFALWGHGRTPRAVPVSRMGEALKRLLSRRADRFFAYNDLSACYVRDLGVRPDRITVVQNAIDSAALAKADVALSDGDVQAEARRLGLAGDNLCLFVGAMYREKRLPFLIAACELVRQRVPDFEMLFLGSGPEQHIVEEAASRNSWMRHIGPLHDARRIPYYRLAKLVLMPGGVGLGVLDAFTLATPLVTTAVSYQGPEIGYLENGVNGVIVKDHDSPAAYASRVADLLADEAALAALRRGCIESAGRYSVERMARNFADGLLTSLSSR